MNKKLTDIQEYRLEVISSAEKIGFTEAAKVFNLDRHTISIWKKKYEKFGVEGLLNRSRKGDNHLNRMPKEVEDKIVDYKRRNPEKSGSDIKRELNIDYSLKVILKRLADNGFGKKVKGKDERVGDRVGAGKSSDTNLTIFFTIEKFSNPNFEYQFYMLFHLPQLNLNYIYPLVSRDDIGISTVLDLFLSFFFHRTKQFVSHREIVLIPLKRGIISLIKKDKSFTKITISNHNISIDIDRDQKELDSIRYKLKKVPIVKFVDSLTSCNVNIDEINLKNCYLNYCNSSRSDKSISHNDLVSLLLIATIDYKVLDSSTIRSSLIGKELNQKVKDYYLKLSSDYNGRLLDLIKDRALELKYSDPKVAREKFYILKTFSKLLNRSNEEILHIELEIVKINISMGDLLSSIDLLKSILNSGKKINNISIQIESYQLLGKLELRVGNIEKARINLDRGIVLAKSEGCFEDYLNCRSALATFYINTGETVKGKELILEIYHEAVKENLDGLRRYSLIRLVKIYSDLGDQDKAKRVLDHVEADAENCEDYSSLVTIYKIIVPIFTFYFSSSNLESYIERMEAIIPKVEENLLQLSDLLNSLAYANISLNNYDRSMEYLYKVLNISEISDLHDIHCTALQNIGVQFFNRRRHKTSIKYYKRSVELSEKKDLPLISIDGNLNLAKYYYIYNRNQQSLIHSLKAVEIAKKFNQYRSIVDGYVNISMNYLRIGDFANGESISKVITRLINLYKQSFFTGCLYNIRGIIYTYKKRYSLAEKYFSKGLNSMKKMGNNYYLSEILFYYGKLLFIQKRFDKAFQLLMNAIDLSEQYGMYHILKDAKKLILRIERKGIKGSFLGS